MLERDHAMVTMHITVDVNDDRKIEVTLPREVPIGKVDLVISVASSAEPKKPRTSLAAWADENGEHLGDKINSEDVEGFTGRRY